MKLKTTLFLLAMITVSSISASAQTFSFGDTTEAGQAQADLDGFASGSTVSGALTLTTTASSGTFNSTASAGFGINASPSGDSTTQFDDGSSDGAEFMTFSFDQDVTFMSILLTNFGSGTDSAFLTIGGSTTTIDSGSFVFAPGVSLGANTDATFGFGSGNGFELKSLTVVVPEPGTYTLIAGISALSFVILRRRLK